MEKYIQRPGMVQKLRSQRKPLIHMFWCVWLLSLDHWESACQSTRLRQYLQTHQRRWKGNYFSLQAVPTIFQWLSLGEKIFYQQIWCNDGIFRRCWDMRTGGLLFVVLPNQTVWQQHRPIQGRWFGSVWLHAATDRKNQEGFLQNFPRKRTKNHSRSQHH